MPAKAVELPSVVKLIRGWLSACDTHHDCVASSGSPQAKDQNPTWVIDTQQKCIVQGALEGRYLALSYTWPETMKHVQQTGVQPLRLDHARLLHFQTPESLEDPSAPLPKIIRDVIDLTKMIGERYLWVDCLCIIQDALDDTTSEVMRMDQIYSGAYLTIIAAGDHGLYTESRPPKVYSPCDTGLCNHITSNKIRTQCPSAKCINNGITAHYKDLSASKWATRGWTYQEQILSRRSIVFLDSGFFWECDRSVWDGHNLSPENDGSQTAEASEMGRRLLALRWPDFGLYIDIVCLYNYREFSYEQDALPAISGIFNIMEPVYRGGFIGGLPSMFLDCALLWQPLRKSKRRVHMPKDLNTPASGLGPPSWSWCGWQCLVDPWSLQSGLSYINTEKQQALAGTCRTYNLITWSIRTTYGNERTIYEPSNLDQQAAGTLTSYISNTSTMWPSDASVAVPLYNGDSRTSFKLPIPIGEPSLSYNINNTSQWLRCTTTRVFFRPAAVLQAVNVGLSMGAPKISAFEHPLLTSCPRKDDVTPVMVLQDIHGRRSGLLRLMHNEEDYDRLDQIELIAISTGSCSVQDMIGCFEQQAFRGMVEWPGSTMTLYFSPVWLYETLRPDVGSESESPRLTLPSSLLQESVTYGIDETCYFYNVLWIERKDGIAYRRACGRILKSIWEQNIYGNTEITLG